MQQTIHLHAIETAMISMISKTHKLSSVSLKVFLLRALLPPPHGCSPNQPTCPDVERPTAGSGRHTEADQDRTCTGPQFTPAGR